MQGPALSFSGLPYPWLAVLSTAVQNYHLASSCTSSKPAVEVKADKDKPPCKFPCPQGAPALTIEPVGGQAISLTPTNLLLPHSDVGNTLTPHRGSRSQMGHFLSTPFLSHLPGDCCGFQFLQCCGVSLSSSAVTYPLWQEFTTGRSRSRSHQENQLTQAWMGEIGNVSKRSVGLQSCSKLQLGLEH